MYGVKAQAAKKYLFFPLFEFIFAVLKQ